MAKVTSKLQVTVPKAIAEAYRIRPGDEIEWTAGGDAIRVHKVEAGKVLDEPAARLELFDQATRRQRQREAGRRRPRPARKRGWTRDDLYDRGRAG